MEEVKIYTDGGSRGNPGQSAGAFVICKMDDTVVEKTGFYLGVLTNNQAEYRALIRGLEKLSQIGVRRINVFMDSEFIVRQLNGLYKVKNAGIKPLFSEVQAQLQNFDSVVFSHVPRAKNSLADKEVNRILDIHSGK